MAAYGRLDVHDPTGAVKSYHLTNEVTTVGRSVDNSIIIDDPTVADRHFRLQLIDGVVHLINQDSSVGIMFAGLVVRDSLPRPMNDGVEFALGKTKIVFYPSSDQPTLPMRSVSEPTRPMDASFHVDLEKSVIDVYPASSSSVEIAITNRSDKEMQFAIDVDGLPKRWAKLSQSSARLEGDDTAFVVLSVAPARRADVQPGEYPATIIIRSLGDNGTGARLALLVRLHGFGGLSLAVEPALVEDSRSLQLFMLNQGNEDLCLAVSAYDPEGQLDIELKERSVQLAAGQRWSIACGVAARNRPLAGKSRKISFALLVQAENDSAYLVAIPASVLVKPRLSALNIGAIVVLIAAFAVTMASLLSRAPPPEISSFAISESRVARGTTVELTWQATFASHFVIEINRVAVAEVEADTRSFALSTDDYIDPIEVALIAVSGEAADIEKRQLVVYQPVSITNFEADRNQMFRRVEDKLVLMFQAKGQVSIDLNFPPEFDIVSSEDLGDGMRKLVLKGVPDTDFDLVLSAKDEIGTRVEGRISIVTADPECTPLRDVTLFSGPDRLFKQTFVAVSNVPVLVVGRATGGDWLLVELASGESGWGTTSDFFCAAFDPAALVVITDLPQLPTTTPTQTPEPTPSPTATESVSPTTIPSATTAATANDDES